MVIEDIRSLRSFMLGQLIGRERLVERLLIGLLTGGHILIEGAPGLGKTRAVKLLSAGMESSFSRVQCTPDLMPADVTGTPVFRPDKGTFEFNQGPVFNSLVLVDEINRAPPKVQSALLEAMAERQVTSGGVTYALPDPFIVIATQNPIEHEGTFPLPEAQLDRFLLYVRLDQPDAEHELKILEIADSEALNEQVSRPEALPSAAILEAQNQVGKVHISPLLKSYIISIVTATRQGIGSEGIAGKIEHAISPRGSIALARAARARAFLDGRDYATPDDVADVAEDALAHRFVLQWRAKADGLTERAMVRRILDHIEPV